MLDSPLIDPPDAPEFPTSPEVCNYIQAKIRRDERMTKCPPETLPHKDVSFQVTFGDRNLVTIVDARSHYDEDETALVLVFDLQDYGVGSLFEELKGRTERNSVLLAESIVFPQRPVVALVFRNFGAFEKQVKIIGFPWEGSQHIFDANVAVEHIKTSLNSQLKAQGWGYTFALNDNKDMKPYETLYRLRELITNVNKSSVTPENASNIESQI
jgi:hypothetical protein